MMKKRNGKATWLAANPIPFASYINSNISCTVRRKAPLTLETGRDFQRSDG